MKHAKVGADEFIRATGAGAGDVDGLPRVDVSAPVIEADEQDLPRLAMMAWAALEVANDPPAFFRWGGSLARIEHDEAGAPLARVLTADRLRHHLARVAQWVTRRGVNLVPTYPPMPVVRDLLARPEPPLPVLEAISETPVFTPSGRLHVTPGYDPESRVVYAPAPGFVVPVVPSVPTTADVSAARQLLLEELFGDFPFVGEPDRAHALGLTLTLFTRPLIAGPVPLTLVEKPSPGTGASLLIAALARVAMGRDPGVLSEGEDEDEWRKRVTATLLAGPALVWIDNLRRPLDSAALSAAITSTVWRDRLLGQSEILRLPVRCAWVATGNNPVLSHEMARRTVTCRLDARVDRPWERHGFRHPDLLAWVETERPALVHACLVLCQAWLSAGRPAPTTAPVLGMFEGWARVIGGILAVAEIRGFLANRQALYERADGETAVVRAFLGLWWAQHGPAPQSVAALETLALHPEVSLDIDAKTEQGRRVRLGRFLQKIQDRTYTLPDGRCLRVEKAETTSATGGIRWALSEGPEGSEDSYTYSHVHARARESRSDNPRNPPDPPDEPAWVRGEDEP